jgi:hypothetical protein
MLADVASRDPSSDRVERPARQRRRRALAVAAPLVAVLAGLWAERRPIATHVIDRALARAGVPARYRLVSLGPGRQRLTDVVIGDPAHPDLVADWIETDTGIGLHGPALTGVRVGRVRLRGRLVGGHLSLGAIDRLMPRGTGGAAGLPALSVSLGDVRMRLETGFGTIGAGLSGRGRLDDGFVGRLAVVGAGLEAGGCTLHGAQAVLRVRTQRGQVGLAGPIGADRLACGATRLEQPRIVVDAGVDPVALRWRGRMQLAGGGLRHPAARADAVAGQATFDGDSGAVAGDLALSATDVGGSGAHAARVFARGHYALGLESRFAGTLGATGASAGRAALLAIGRSGEGAAATPVGPVLARGATALVAAARSFGGSLALDIARRDGVLTTLVRHGAIVSASGATASVEGRGTSGGAIDARLSLAGGDLPSLTATLTRAAMAAPLVGTATIRPYAAAGASIALAPTRFAWTPDGEARVDTVATISGPFAGQGRIDAMSIPLAIRRDAAGVVAVNGGGCSPVAAGRLVAGDLRLDAVRLRVCPLGGGVAVIGRDGGVTGGVSIDALRVSGRSGDAPLAIAIGGMTAAWATRAVAAHDVALRLGPDDRQTRLDLGAIGGRAVAGGWRGDVAGAGGRIGAVPLLLSQAAGRWRFASGALTLDGALRVADADAASPRFNPLQARDVTLRLANGRIAAIGTLTEPLGGAPVAAVAIAHDLTRGTGSADLRVERLTFGPALQPDRLTPSTKGVIADVAGTVDGEGHIAWGDAGVTSTGRFATPGLNLAAAFGPVTGIAGSIAFTDLLGLVSAPGQQVTVASINPGVAVEDGTVRFHLEPGLKVAVEDARWPFAGGTLTLDPTLLDFAGAAERHMTFRLDQVAADRFLQQFDFKNLAATGTFDGVLPMVFDARGGRIEGGRLTVREGGGGIAYVGDLGQKDLGFWANLAFGALKSLRYRSLGIAMNGPLDGEMITDVRFAGISQGQGAKSNFLIGRLQRLPLVFNVRIKAPFRALLDGLDPAHQAQLALPRLLDEERQAAVQHSASEPVP